jgi:hypothetical protein
MLIQVKFVIQNKDLMERKKIQFCKIHEKNLHVMYGIAKESIERKRTTSLDQITSILCFHIVNGIRKNQISEIIQKKILSEVTTIGGMEVTKIHIEAMVDDIPKKIIEVSPSEYAASLSGQRALT